MTRIGIIGYGNIGRGVELAVMKNDDIELVAVFTRRDPSSVKIIGNAKVVLFDEMESYKDKIDVMILCGGSANDLPDQTADIINSFNTVDSFDTHAKIPEYFNKVNKAAALSGKIGVISVGWDPGLFSMIRMMSGAILPDGKDYTFWGKGVSQGHSSAVRQIKGVKNAIQYTVPMDEAIEKVRSGISPELSTRDKHLRECFVVAEDDADLQQIENDIKTMPNYFAEYNTVVHFISEETFNSDHIRMPHGGFVFRTGATSDENKHVIEFSLKLDSNPEFTAGVMIAYARAAHRMFTEGMTGAKTAFDIPLSYLSPLSDDVLRATLL